MTFTQQNTDGYTDQQLSDLQDELKARLAGLEPDSDEYQQAEKAFADEVARRPKKETIRERVSDAVLEQSAQACINQHTRNIHTLYAMPDGRVYWGEEVSTNSWDVLAGTVHPVAVIFQTGTGSCGCNCDACMAGDDPTEWAGDYAGELWDELISKVEGIESGYFDDEQEG